MKNIYSVLRPCSLLFFACTRLYAQQSDAGIKGHVYEQQQNTQAPIPGAIIIDIKTNAGTQTDSTGQFLLSGISYPAQLAVAASGYQADTVLVTRLGELNFLLKPEKALKEVVVAATQHTSEMSMLDPVQKINISNNELLKAACCNLGESFETTPSIDASFTDAVTGYRQIQMLGLAGPYTLITRENIPDVRGLAAITGLTFTPGSWIESMQLSKGTGSVVNGYEGVAGQINIEMVKPFEEKKNIINLYQSIQGRSEANLVYNKKFSDKLSSNILLHGNARWQKWDQNKDGFLDQPLGKSFAGINRWFYSSGKGLELQGGVKYTYVNNTGGQWAYNTGTEQVAGNPWGYLQKINRTEGWAKIGKVWMDKRWKSVGLQLSAVHHNQESTYGSRAYNALENSLYSNLIYQSVIDNTNHIIKFGASFLADHYNEQFSMLNYKRTELVPGIFTEYAWTPGKKWNLVAGLRGDYHNMYGVFITPRLHLRYAPLEKTSIRASVGRSQRTANIFAENMGLMASNRSFIIQSAATEKAYGLNPEVAWNIGASITQKFRLNYRQGSFAVDYYYTNFQNQIVVDMEDPKKVVFYNLDGKSFAHSFMAQLDYEPIRKWDVRLAYRWYDVQTSYTGVLKERPLVSRHRAFVNTGYSTKSNWKLDYTVQWVSPKRVPGSLFAPAYRSPAYVLMNAQLSKSWNNGIFEVYLGGENLTNYMQHHAVIGAAAPFSDGFDASLVWGPVMGRNVYAGLRWKL